MKIGGLVILLVAIKYLLTVLGLILLGIGIKAFMWAAGIVLIWEALQIQVKIKMRNLY